MSIQTQTQGREKRRSSSLPDWVLILGYMQKNDECKPTF